MDDEAYDASDVEQVQRAKVNAGRRKKLLDQASERMMKDPAMKEWLWELLKFCHPDQISHTGEPLSTAFREGERNVGLWVKAKLASSDPEGFLRMSLEKGGIQHDGKRSGRENGDSN
jgi:hypothetical protein